MSTPVVEDIAINLPKKSEVASAAGAYRRKPKAEVVLDCGPDGTRSIWVPVRVARLIAKDMPELPRALDEVRSWVAGREESCCFAACVDALARRDHSSDELKRKLSLAGYRDQSVSRALERAREARYLDDDRFASYFIQERIARGWGRRKIEVELRRRGIDARGIPGYPDAFFSEDDDLARARALLARKSIPEVRPFEKLVRHLMAKGYSYATASAAVHAYLES